ncbi:MAG: ATP-binding cassette domain-containing protein, partial [Ilumatobacter sp.]|nr:ATP-binding cassette domain-containing protein [Ilumatobacter sp.]
MSTISMLPATKAVPKELFPIGDQPALQIVIDEALGAGIDHIVVVSSRSKPAVAQYFEADDALLGALEDKGKSDTAERLRAIGRDWRVSIVYQDNPKGLGHAVGCAREAVGDEPFAGETLGVVGESGSGKTVLSRTIMGLLPSTAVLGGSVKFAGQETLGLDAKQMRHLWGREMSMVFQNPMVSLNPLMKIGKQSTEPLIIHLGMDKANARESALTLLRDVRIPEPEKRLDQFPHELSGGMRQRVMIAIALACGPTLLFADEPTTALDVTVQAQVMEVLHEVQQATGSAMMLITHDLGVVATRTREIAVMYAGKIVEKAPTRKLFSEMRHPYTQSLLWSIPKTSQPKHTRLSAIAGRPPDLIHPPPGCKFAPRCAYAQPLCIEVEPPLRTDATGHQFACHIPVGTPENQAAFDSNLEAGLAQTLTAAGKMSAREDLVPDY